MNFLITSEIKETNPYRGTSTAPIEYELILKCKGSLGEVEYVRDQLLNHKYTGVFE